MQLRKKGGFTKTCHSSGGYWGLWGGLMPIAYLFYPFVQPSGKHKALAFNYLGINILHINSVREQTATKIFGQTKEPRVLSRSAIIVNYGKRGNR